MIKLSEPQPAAKQISKTMVKAVAAIRNACFMTRPFLFLLSFQAMIEKKTTV
jgi:hypothetical protein